MIIETDIAEMSDGKKLTVYIAKDEAPSSKSPVMVVFHGLGGHGREDGALMMMDVLTKAGFIVFSYDQRGVNSKKPERSGITMPASISSKYFKKVFDDPLKIVNFVVNYPLVDKDNIHIVGGSLGGAIVLSTLLNHPSVKKIFAMCAPYDYQALVEDSKQKKSRKKHSLYDLLQFKMLWKFKDFLRVVHEISPVSHIQDHPQTPYSERVYLIQSEDDPTVDYQTQYMKIKTAMQIPESHILLFKDGGHTCRKYYKEIAEKIKDWLQ